MIGSTAERARAMVESAAPDVADVGDGRGGQRQAEGGRRAGASRRVIADRRRRARAGVTLRGVIARPSRGRRATGLRHGLGAVGLLALLLLAILPAHASGLTSGSVARAAPRGPVRAQSGEVSSIGASQASSSTRLEEAGLGEASVDRSEEAGVEAAEAGVEAAEAGVEAGSAPADDEPVILASSAPPTIGWFRLAAREQVVNVDLLRALHQVESNASPDGCIENAQGSGALGPFQLKPATFRAYGVDANHDGRRDICSFADALFSAARYLRALGAGDLDAPQTRQALTRYGTDPDRVLSLALSYRDRVAQVD